MMPARLHDTPEPTDSRTQQTQPEPRKRTLPAGGQGAWPEPPVLGERWLRAAERPFLWLERAIARGLPEPLNPLLQTGAVAVVTLLVAIVTGVLLLFWYSSSVTHAYASVEAMAQAPLTAGLVRSLHRYSSDACMLFVLLHAVRLFLARRFGGPRHLAWVTGVLLILGLWSVGWLGYWLVWDERAQQVAVGTARMMDVLPLFADPLSRSFLTDGRVNSLLFFVVFFLHMLIPLGMGIPLWLHITRLARARYLTRLPLTAWVLGTLLAVSLLAPAGSAGPARMTVAPGGFSLDAWYLLPLALTDRLGAGALWAVFLLVSLVPLSLPWVLQRRRAQPAAVNVSACNGCTLCAEDCPYDAIRMVPRTDGRRFEVQAVIDPARCVGCGICAGSCDPGAIGLEPLPVVAARQQVEGWVAEDVAAGRGPSVAFVCTSSAGGALRPDAHGHCPELVGYRVLPVPCTGWVHALTVERALKRGARGVLMVGCGPGECTYREGARWTGQRLDGERAPALRHEKVERERVRFLRLDAADVAALSREAALFRTGWSGQPPPPRALRLAVQAASLAAAVALVVVPSQLGYAGPQPVSELVVSFKHPGRVGEHCRKVSAEELARQPVHMRQETVCERGRADVVLRVEVDGAVALERPYAPRGLSRDGNSVAVERLPVPPGRHHVRVALRDGGQEGEWAFSEAREVEVGPGRRQVVLFDRVAGFLWEGG